MMKRRILSVTLACAMLAGLFACAPVQGASLLVQKVLSSDALSSAEGEERTTDTADAGGTQTQPAAAQPAMTLLDELPVLYDTGLTPAVPAFTVEPDFSNVINGDRMEYWNDEARQMLLQNGFLVTSGGWEFYEVYENNRYVYEPNYVTTDALLHTYHLYFVYLQSRVEKNELSSALLSLSTAMQQQSQAQYDALKGTEWENAALRNLAFFSVGVSLLQPDASVPEPVAGLVSQELALIQAASDISASPVMNLDKVSSPDALLEDYTQYIPRSYYAGDAVLEPYFRAMMWYGRMAFRASDEDQTRSAVLLTLALQDENAAATWERLYAVTSFFAGASDDATYLDYTPLVDAAYGEGVTVTDLPGKDKAFASFCDSLATLTPAAVNSIPIYDNQDNETATAGMRFMGQRFTLDAAVFQQLIYDNVAQKADGAQRMLPDALDLPAALGSDTALAILTEQGDTDYPGYTENMESVRTALSQAPSGVWSASLYAAWVDALRPLTEAKGEGWPQFMQNDAWTRKSLSTMLGSWTELKHDTALYAKQVYAEMGGGGIEEADDRGWVETEPEVFGKLSALSQATADGLDKLGLLEEADAENLGILADLCRQLMVIAEKELRNEMPTDDEFELIRTIGGQLEHFWTETVADEESGLYTPQQAPAALVADVGTDPNGTVRQVGTDVNTIYVIVNVGGSLRIASGSVFGFYQFEQPMSERMTDQQWWSRLGLSPDESGNWNFQDPPARPGWINFTMENLYQ